jgi:DNA-binding CsgD family transcriptional regulator
MADPKTLTHARQRFAQSAWADAHRLLDAADSDVGLEPEDVERLATAAYLVGRDEQSEYCWGRAHQAFLERGDHEGAARSAAWLAFGLLQRGTLAPAAGWIARAGRILDEARLDSVVRGYLLIPSAIQKVVQGDPAAGDDTFGEAAGMARRFGDRDLASLACAGRGRARIRLGRIAEGVALLDEAMVAVTAGEVTPVLAGDIYCIVLEACQETFDLRRAHEWTASLARWCDSQPGLVRYRGECLLYRAEVMQLRGMWNDAARDAREATALLMSRPAAGAGFYRAAEIHRLRGEFDRAEAAYAQANEHGRKPQPGLSLLRLVQGRIEAAAVSIGSALLDTPLRAARARLLPAAVEILLAAGDLEQARGAAAELSEIAGVLGAPLLAAASAHATGAVLLANGDIAGAGASLRRAAEGWRDLEMPYEQGETCLLMAAVCERRGDRDGRDLELERARGLFTQLGAEARLSRLEKQASGGARQPAGALSDRELQVLQQLAAGRTNRDIARDLRISEKTVARHVSNIFDKLGVSSRTSAAAWAYQHHIV